MSKNEAQTCYEYVEPKLIKDIENQDHVIAVTSKLLTTGVDVPTCKNVILARFIRSMTDFKQIIGRVVLRKNTAKSPLISWIILIALYYLTILILMVNLL